VVKHHSLGNTGSAGGEAQSEEVLRVSFFDRMSFFIAFGQNILVVYNLIASFLKVGYQFRGEGLTCHQSLEVVLVLEGEKILGGSD